MIKRSKRIFLAALSLIGLSIGISAKADSVKDVNVDLPVGGNYYFLSQGFDGAVKSISCVQQGGNINPLVTAGKNGISSYFDCSTPGSAKYFCTAKVPAFVLLSKLKFTNFNVTCTGASSEESDKCYLCNGTNYFYTHSAPCDNAVDVGINDKSACLKLNPTTCRLCNDTYTFTDNPNCQFLGVSDNKEACEARNHSIVDEGNGSSGNGNGSSSGSGSSSGNGGGIVPVTPAPSDKRLSIADVAEEEDTSLKPPSRPTNAATGACEDYVVTYEGLTRGIAVNSSHSIYKYYSAKSNCTDNQGQEFAAFCMDPTLIGPGGSAGGQTMPTSANYQIMQYLDPKDSEFAKGAVYIYKKFLEAGSSVESRCASEVAMRYLEFTVGGLEPRYGGPYSGDAARYASTSIGGSCGAAGLALYQEALAASVEEASEGYNSVEAQVTPNISQDDEGNVSGYIEVTGPNGEEVGITSVECPAGLSCEASGNRINVSGTIGCDEATLKAAIGTTSESAIKSVLLAEAASQSNVQRFILFQTGGPVAAGITYNFTPSDNCNENGCKTDVDFACAPAGSYDNPIILKEGTLDGGETDWATCIYNNTDPKGNTYNALKNDYCVVSCAEEWDFRLPGNIQTVSGRNFSFIARIGAKRTCKLVGDYSGGGVITPVNYRRSDGKASGPQAGATSFAEDYYYWAERMVSFYNKYLYEKAVAQAIEDYLDETPPNAHYEQSGASYSDSDHCRGASNETEIDWQHDEDEPGESDGYYSHYAQLRQYVANYFKTKYVFQLASSRHVIAVSATASDQAYTLPPNGVSTEASAESYTVTVSNPNYNPRVDPYSSRNMDVACTKTGTETYEDPDNRDYKKTIQEHKDAAASAFSSYQQALNKVQNALKMYNECTDWKNEYEFEPEIRFTYQEQSYMDLIMKHQNKNYLINRTELDPESPRSNALTLYDIEIAVGTPGNNLDGLSGDGTSGSEGWSSPLDGELVCTGAKGRTSSYDATPHRGIDLRARYVPVKAAKSGTVSEATSHYSWGNYVKIDHGDQTTSLYAHLSQISVSRGSHVSQGQVIGISGATGNVSGPHLHLEITQNGALIDPAPIYGLSCPEGSSEDTISPVGGNPNIVNEVQTYGETYQYIQDTGGYVGTINEESVKEATYGISEVEYKAEETEYRSGVHFYTTNPDGLVTTTKDEGNPNQTDLGYVYPVSLNTPQGNYPYTLDFGYIGMYNDSNELGRIMGASNSSLLSGSAADYVCHYNVCDPTVEDCPPQMCDEFVDKNGETHYYDKEGNETDKKTHDEQCSDLSKSCTWQTDENGNDTFCDKSGNCSSDPSGYLRDCAKECMGYSLVSYENYTGAEVNNSGRLQFLPKVISLNNLFSSGDESAKAINWQTTKAQTVRKQIEEAGESIFANPQYEFELTPTAMANIREYNKSQLNDGGYADFTLTCNYNSNGKYGTNCHSNFLDSLASRGVTVIKRDQSFTADDKGYSYK